MGLANKFKTFFFTDEEEYYEEEALQENKQAKNKFHATNEPEKKVISMQSAQYTSRMILSEPRVYAEAQELADHLKEYKIVVVNLQRIGHEQAVRVVDFLSGTVYALGGDIQRVGHNIFLCTPDNVEINGSISEMLEEQDLMYK